MPSFEERIEEFRCTVIHSDRRRITVTLPHKHHYTVEEVLRETKIDYRGFSVRRTNITLTLADVVEHGHVIELFDVRQGDCCTDEILIDVIAFGQRHQVRLPHRPGCSYTVEEVLRHSRIPNWESCQLRRNDGFTITTTTVVENGHVIYVLTKIKGNK
jgi:hypothetical protein